MCDLSVGCSFICHWQGRKVGNVEGEWSGVSKDDFPGKSLFAGQLCLRMSSRAGETRAGLQHSEISLGQFGSEFFLIIWSQLLLSVSGRSCRNISFSAVEVRIYCAMYNCRKSNSVIFPCSKTDFCGCFQRSGKGSGL